MKGKKHKASGGATNNAESGDKDWEADEKTKPMKYTADSNVDKEAEEKKHGGKIKKRKHGGKAEGEMKRHAGRMPRKDGGRTGSNFSPMSSAHSGTPAKGHSTPGSTD